MKTDDTRNARVGIKTTNMCPKNWKYPLLYENLRVENLCYISFIYFT